MATTSRFPRSVKTETDVAVLQVQVQNIEDRMIEVKAGMRDINETVKANHESMLGMLKEMQQSAEKAHGDLNKKISALEKWRWMIMGAGMVLGSLGFEAIAKLFQAH
jgi:hypothetical protein